MNRPRQAPLLAALLLLLAGAPAFASSIAPAALRDSHARIAPAMGVVRYTAEITNPNTGETSRRDNTALALVVTAGGLALAHGHMALENTRPFNIKVTLGQGASQRDFDAQLLPKPEDVNVVFLLLQSDEALDLPHVRLDPRARIALGDPVVVFGLLGDTFDNAPAMLDSRVGAVLDEPRATYALSEPIRFNYVGGPVVNARGQVAGVAGFELSRAEGGDLYTRSGHPLIIHAELLADYIANPPAHDMPAPHEDQAWLGVFTQPLTDDFAEYWDLPQEGGLIVSTVVPGSPAEAAGLRAGDVIVEFGGAPIRVKLDRDVLRFTQLVREQGPGADVEMGILRGGERIAIQATLGARPRTAREAREIEAPAIGLTLREITTDIRIALNLPEQVQGLIVRRVRSGSPAQLARMRAGMILMGVNDTPVRSMDDFAGIMETLRAERPPQVTIFAGIGAATGFFRVEPRWGDE